MDLTFDLGVVETTMLVSVRMLAFLVVSPPFHVSTFPGTVKVALSLGLALAVGPAAVARAGIVPGEMLVTGGAAFIGAVVLEAFVGLALGFLVRLVFAAVQTAGGLIDLFGGFEVAAALDPTSGTHGAQFNRFYSMAALALLFASDGHQLLLMGIVRSFDALPLGSGIDLAVLGQLMTTGAAQMMIGALQIAGPLIAVLFLTDVGLGLLTRVAPALNAFALGFPLKILVTLSLGSIAFLALPAVISSLTDRATDLMGGGAW
ncbi:flagellar biosynthetic protein FliR [Demequina mangrovi]|uniref:Flagellar biosynthetic protein FliR n=1 Tax=Demequina mangrovi TaxID=1043493 RepID=A0A1H7A4B1_9MICO|nr:flagellar biosynthetic protein FliR [Demequina mangrovi]SEJ55885.1 flagellar biosynthetic protein FliR [Demequina mangrovi]